MLGAWIIWKEGNNLLFNEVTPDIDFWNRRFTTDFRLLVYRTKPELHNHINSLIDSM
jgi:hypothetical protein